MLIEALPAWPKNWQVIHLVGKERPKELAQRVAGVFPNYHMFEFFTEEMKYAYAAADAVVARAGFNTITELALLFKGAVLLPKEGHQQANAKFLDDHEAAWVLNEKVDSGLKLAQLVKELILIPEKRRVLGKNLHALLPIADPMKIVEIVEKLLG
jgi:UDP-N-acetylglucosamine:LPS N-acetylglucosamine transferase